MARGKLSTLRKRLKKGTSSISYTIKFMELQKEGCHYCGVQLVSNDNCRHDNSATIDHKVAYCHSSLNRIDNYVHCCNLCNNLKDSSSYEDFVEIANKYLRPVRNTKYLIVHNLRLMNKEGMSSMILRNKDYWNSREQNK